MSTDDGALSAREHNELRDLVLAGTQRIRPARAGRTQFVAAGVALVLVGAVTGGIITATLRGGGAPDPVAPSPSPSPSPTTTQLESWVAYSSGLHEGDIYFVKAGSAPHRVLGADDDTLDQVCPAFSADGGRLASGQASGDEQSGWHDVALVITDLTADGEARASEVIPIEGARRPPCPIWSPDGRWIAFGGSSDRGATWGVAKEVWLVDTETGAVRLLTEPAVTDLDWSTDGTQLYIADQDGIVTFSVAEGETRTIADTAGALGITMSPNGDTMAVERRRSDSTELTERYDLWLMSLGGADRRVLVEDYTHSRGIGPVWSPDGNRIVFQRSGDAPTRAPDEIGILGENEQVVVVSASDDDALGPVGTQRVLKTVETADGTAPRTWFPMTVSWAPDSTTLRFLGWELLATGDMGSGSGLLTVPVDDATPPAILWETPEGIGPPSVFPQNDFQSWSSR